MRLLLQADNFRHNIQLFKITTRFITEYFPYHINNIRILRRNISFRQSKCLLIKSENQVFCKKGVLSNSTKFTGKHLCQVLFFNKVAGLKPRNFNKKRDAATSVFL